MFKTLADIERLAAAGKPSRVIRQFVGSYLQGEALRAQYAATLGEDETPGEVEFLAWLAEQRQNRDWTPPEITAEAVEAWLGDHYAEMRAGAYPALGDQLDAIWKVINQLCLEGTELPQDGNDMLGRILAVKREHPKPKLQHSE